MIKSISFFLGLFISGILYGQSFTGKWKGDLDVQTIKLLLIFDISQEGNNYKAFFTKPDAE